MHSQKLSLFLLPFVASCSLIGTETPTDFSSLYKAHVQAQMSDIRELAEDLGYMESYTADGAFRMMADIPMILSGAVSTSYEAKVHGQDVDIQLLSPSMSYETILASGSIVAKEIALMTKAGDTFLRYDEMKTIGLIEGDITTIIEKYKNTWLSMNQPWIMGSLSWASEEDIMAEKISQAMTKMTLSDVEGYLLKYPLWKEKKNLGMSGDFQSYEVEFARESILAFVEDFSREATGKDIDPEAKSTLRSSLESINIEGTLSFDTKNAGQIAFDGVLRSASGETVALTMKKTKEVISLTTRTGDMTTVFSLVKNTNGYVMNMTASQSGAEMMSVVGNVKKEGDRIARIDMTLSAASEWLTVTLEHLSSADGNFEWKLNAGIGNLTWKGKLEKTGLAEFHLGGAMIGSSLKMDLLPGTGSMLRWPLILKSGDDTLVSADIWLQVSREQLTLMLDVISPEDPSMKSHAEIDIRGRRTPWSGNIEAPKDTKPFKLFADELSALMPKNDMFIEESNMDTETLDSWDTSSLEN